MKRTVVFNENLIIHEFNKKSKILQDSNYGENKLKDFFEDCKEFLIDFYDNIKYKIQNDITKFKIKFKMT